MKLGLFFDLRNPEPWARPWTELYGRTLELLEGAEDMGLQSAWFTEHHLFEDGYLPQPLTFLAAVAARARRITIGTAVLLGALRPAPLVAEEVAVVDQISGGRLELGIGAGYSPREYELYDRDLSHRYGLTDAAVAEIRRLLDDGVVTPPPAQRPFPIWLGYQGPQGARRAGRLGVGLLSLDQRLLEPYREGLVEGGYDPAVARTGGMLDVIVADDPEAALERSSPTTCTRPTPTPSARWRNRCGASGAHRREGPLAAHRPGFGAGPPGAHRRRGRGRPARGGHRRRPGRARVPVGQCRGHARRPRRAPRRAALPPGRAGAHHHLIPDGSTATAPRRRSCAGYRSGWRMGHPMDRGEVQWVYVLSARSCFSRRGPWVHADPAGGQWVWWGLQRSGQDRFVLGGSFRSDLGRRRPRGSPGSHCRPWPRRPAPRRPPAPRRRSRPRHLGCERRRHGALARYHHCGSLTKPTEWPDSPTPDGSIRPAGCGAVMDARRLQVAALWIGAVAMAGALAVVVRAAPDPDVPALHRLVLGIRSPDELTGPPPRRGSGLLLTGAVDGLR